MIEARRAIPVLLIHFLFGFIGCLVFSFLTPLSVNLLDPFIQGFRFRSGVLLFIGYIPALQISGLLIGYALAFSKNASETVERWSGQLLSYLKGAFILCLIFISIYIVLAEGVAPFLLTRQDESIARTDDYNDFISISKDSFARGLTAEAEFQANRALQIWSKSPETNKILDIIRLEIGDSNDNAFGLENKSKADSAPVFFGSEGLSVRMALDKANKAYSDEDFYNAHYYAMLAWSIAPATDPNKSEAMQAASAAWNQITEGMDLLKAEGDKQLYSTKHYGYEAIQRKDYLKAYYIFSALQTQQLGSKDKKIDPDVERFLDVSRKGVLESFFFIDETLNMQLFETARDVFFVIKGTDGISHCIFIRGVTYTTEGGRDMAFLRDFEYARIDRHNKLDYHYSVPYVKMYPYSTSTGLAQPELLLKAVNRTTEGDEIISEVLYGDVPEMERNMIRLDMPYKDFNLIVAANKGAPSMSLIELMQFIDQAERYGFSRSVYLQEMISRLSDPFLMLIISIYTLVLGWRYRLGKKVLFKAWWILTIPLFPVLSLFVIGSVRYIARLCIVLFVGLVPENSLLLMLVFLALCFTLMSVYFFSQRSD